MQESLCRVHTLNQEVHTLSTFLPFLSLLTVTWAILFFLYLPLLEPFQNEHFGVPFWGEHTAIVLVWAVNFVLVFLFMLTCAMTACTCKILLEEANYFKFSSKISKWSTALRESRSNPGSKVSDYKIGGWSFQFFTLVKSKMLSSWQSKDIQFSPLHPYTHRTQRLVLGALVWQPQLTPLCSQHDCSKQVFSRINLNDEILAPGQIR